VDHLLDLQSLLEVDDGRRLPQNGLDDFEELDDSQFSEAKNMTGGAVLRGVDLPVRAVYQARS
jgi:hypothetical protein